MTRWRKTAFATVGFAVLVVAVNSGVLFQHRNFTGRDLLAYNLPMEKAIHDAYASRSLPLWTPEVSGGRPLLPNPNAGSLYPVRVALAALPFAASVKVFPVLHWTAAGIGMLVLLEMLGVSAGGAWIGAVTYVFSGVSITEVFYPHVQPGFALLPWLIWAVQWPANRRRFRVLVLGFLFGLDFLAADVFTGALALLAVVLWTVRETPAELQKQRLLDVLIAAALGSCLAAPQIAATALWIPLTNRAVLGMKLSEATLFSVSPWRLIEAVVPYPFGPTWELKAALSWGWRIFNGKAIGLFCTLYAGALAPIAVFRAWRTREPGLAFSRAFLICGVAAAVLPSLIPRAWRSLSSPLPLRNPEKLAVAIIFALAIFAARSWDAAWPQKARRRVLSLGAILALLALASASFPGAFASAALRLTGTELRFRPVAAQQLPGAIAEGGLLLMATWVALSLPRESRVGLLLALSLLTAVPLFATARIPETMLEEAAFAPTAFARRVIRSDPQRRFRVLGESAYRPTSAADPNYELSDLGYTEIPYRTWTQHTQILWGYGTIFNYDFDSGDLSRLESLRRVSYMAAGYRDSATFFRNLGLRWGIRMLSQPAISGYRPFGGNAVLAFDQQDVAFPDLRLATEWREESNALDALTAIRQLGPGEVLVETGRKAAGRARPGRLRVLEKSSNRLRLEADVPDPTWLFVLREFWPYRSIRVDGRREEASPAYLALSAVPVPQGRHTIDWREELPGAPFSLVGPALFLVAAVWCIRPAGGLA